MTIEIPTQCPMCESILDRVNDQLFCKNDSCDAKTSKKLLHFIKTMKIKGLGEKTIEKLKLSGIHELYNLSVDEMITQLGEKVGNKLFNEIAQSKTISLPIFIQSFGIPLIGNSATTKLSAYTDSIWNIDEEVCKRAGLGKVATSNLLIWISKNEVNYSDLPITPTVNQQQEEKPEEQFKIAITGKLNDFSSRNKAKDFLATKGISVMSSVTKNVTYLVCDQDDSSSSSIVKANTLKIPVITMNDLLNKINGEN